MKNTTSQTFTPREFIQKFMIDEMSVIVKNHPFYAFSLLAEAIEVLGKCLNPISDWFASGSSENDFYNAINTLKGFELYKCFNFTKKSKDGKTINTNLLYSKLRCGLLHSFLPKEGITLAPSVGNEDLSNNIVGCGELYEAIKTAWAEIDSGNVPSSKDFDSRKIFSVDDGLSATTITTITKQI